MRPFPALAFAAALAACNVSASQNPSSLEPSPTSTVFPSPSPTPPPASLRQAEVALEGLALSAEPRTGSPVIGSLDSGRRVIIVGELSGWVRVEAPLSGSLEYVFGWLPDERDGAATLNPISVACPPSFTLGSLGDLHPEQMRQCAQGLEIELEGILRSERRPLVFVGEPEWLAQASDLLLSNSAGAAGVGGSIFVHFPLDVALPDTGLQMRLRGHFNDPRAVECSRLPVNPALQAEPSADQVLWCQQQFVITWIGAG